MTPINNKVAFSCVQWEITLVYVMDAEHEAEQYFYTTCYSIFRGTLNGATSRTPREGDDEEPPSQIPEGDTWSWKDGTRAGGPATHLACPADKAAGSNFHGAPSGATSQAPWEGGWEGAS